MSTTPGSQPQYEAQFFTNIRNWGITRGENGVFGGVIEGVGDRIGLARVPARLIAILLIPLTGGLFLAAYAVAWAILPNSEGRIIIQDFGRGTTNVPALIGITILGLIGLSVPFGSHPFGWGWVGVTVSTIVGLLIIIGIIALIAWGVTKDEHGQSRLVVEFRRSENAKARAQEAKEAAREAGRAAKDAALEAGRTAKEAAREAGRAAKEAGQKASEGGKVAAKKAKAAAAEIRDAVAVKATSAGGEGVPPVPPTPPYLKPRVPGPSKAVRLLALGAAFLIGAIVWWLERENLLTATPIEAWFAAMVIVVGLAIVATGAAGRRIGAFGFWAAVLVIGWSIWIVVGPKVSDWLDSHEWIWDWDEDVRMVSVEDGTVQCRDYDTTLPASMTTIFVEDQDTLTISETHTTIVVPLHSSITFEQWWGDLDSTISWERQEGLGWEEITTCEIDGESARFRTLGQHDADIDVVVTVPNTVIVIKER